MTLDVNVDLKRLRDIRKAILIGIFSDDSLMELFTLKGGSAIDLAYRLDDRSSFDIDLSMETDIPSSDLDLIAAELERVLGRTLAERGYLIFDYSFTPRPKTLREGSPSFWGGYLVEFKIISQQKKGMVMADLSKARKMAEVTSPFNGRKFSIDISKYERCTPRQGIDIDGYTIYVYEPQLIVIEKIRAICQQMEEYKHGRSRKPRPKDFYDIYVLCSALGVMLGPEDMELVNDVFSVKDVPLELLKLVPMYRRFHSQAAKQLDDTIVGGLQKAFDFYFDFVVEMCSNIIANN